jgi:hypothetical protein
VLLAILGLASAGGLAVGIRAAPATSQLAQAIIRANGAASHLLNEAVVPPTAHRVPEVSARLLGNPATTIACSPLIDGVRFWVVHRSLVEVNEFLMGHPPSGFAVTATGSSSGPTNADDGQDVVDSVPGTDDMSNQLEFTLTEPQVDRTEIRADAMIVPKGARCERHL